MDALIRDYLSALTFGELQTFNNMAMLPLFSAMNDDPDYVTLKDALAQKFIIITEIDDAGRVPELKVVNNSEYFVLLLDGEELIGAKQNRVLTTSILLKPNSETILPVSCTEQGRWGYASKQFSHSDVMMSPLSRFIQAQSVSESLHEGRGFISNQGLVWDDIIRMHARVGVSSRTGAMRDVYSAKTDELDKYLQAFPYVLHQWGCLVFINGDVTGFDLISSEAAYKTIHTLFVKGYAMDALLQKEEQAEGLPSVGKAEMFLQEAKQCQESRFEAVGQGDNYYFEGTNVFGTALVSEKSVIHAAFFKSEYTTEYKVHKTTIRMLFRSITQVGADALVSSDNTRLTMQSGVSRAILKAAGKQVRQEASKHTPLKIGDVVVTSGGKLAAKYIFHAVTTDLDAGRGPSEEDIQTATRKALELAETLGVRRIVFPILGTGGGGFPLDIAAEVMARAIAEHVMKETCIESVILTFPVFGRVQRIALTALNKHFAKLFSEPVQAESQ